VLNVQEAQVLLESGKPAMAAILFDSIAQQPRVGDAPSQQARGTAWMLTQSLGARIAAGDTASVAKLVDSLRALGERSGFGRDRLLHRYVRGLLFAARGDDDAAITELKAAIFAPTTGFTRTNFELARVYLRANRPRDAIAVLQPALRGSLDASNLYVSRTELHERLAQAWDAVGNADSAAVHYAWVMKAWSAPDPSLAPRAAAARTRLAALKHR
jgi:predicted Zn-dependent protease